MKIVFGLGNPGPKYRNTRHNLGFNVIDRLAELLGAHTLRERSQGLVADALLGAERVLLVKPMTYMNRSGDCVAPLARSKARQLQDILVVVDDVNLPLGRLRFRAGGSAGGHNGLKSVAERLGTEDYPRLRIGVGANTSRPDLAGHVLGAFLPEEREPVMEAVARAADGVLCWLEFGLEKAMEKYN